MKKGVSFYDYWLYSANLPITKENLVKAHKRLKKFIREGGEFDGQGDVLNSDTFEEMIKSLGLAPLVDDSDNFLGFSQPDDINLCEALWADGGFVLLQYFSGEIGGINLIDGEAIIEIANHDEEMETNMIQKYVFNGASISEEYYQL